jgi:hypothetical protein
LPDETLLAGKEYILPIVSNKSQDLIGYQFGLFIDTTKLEFIGCTSNPKMTKEELFVNLDTNKLNVIWLIVDDKNLTFPKDSTYLNLRFKIKIEGKIQEMISENPDFSSEYVYVKEILNYVTGPITFNFDTSVKATLVKTTQTNERFLKNKISISPNPVESNSAIYLSGAENYNYYRWVTIDGHQFSFSKITQPEILIPDKLKKGISYFCLYSDREEKPACFPVMIE